MAANFITTKQVKISGSSVQFGEALPIGTQIQDESNNKMYALTAASAATDTLDSSTKVEIGIELFQELTDTPASFTGQKNKLVFVKNDESGLEFRTSTGAGDVTGPGGATADHITVFDGSTGKLVKDGGKAVADLEDSLGNPGADGEILSSTAAGIRSWIVLPTPGDTTFQALTDTPASYVGQTGKASVVNAAETGLEFVPITADTFIGLTDTPTAFVANKNIVVNPAGTAVIFTDNSLDDLSDVGLAFPLADGEVLTWDDGNSRWEAQPSASAGVTSFTGLTDTPSTYAGKGGKTVSVKADTTGLEFTDVATGDVTGPSTSVDDDIALFDGVTGKVVKDGNKKLTDFEDSLGDPTTDGQILASTIAGVRSWIDSGGTGSTTFQALTDTPANYTGEKGKFLAVNEAEAAVEFVDPPTDKDETVYGDWMYESGITAPPSTGKVKFNQPNSTLPNVTKIFIHYVNHGSVNEKDKLLSMRAGYDYRFHTHGVANHSITFRLTGVTEHTDYAELDVTDVASTGTVGPGNIFDLDSIAGGRFIELIDAPSNYTGNARNIPMVSTQEDRLVFERFEFNKLRDTPTNYTGQSGRVATVNAAENALEFTDKAGGGSSTFAALTDTPADYIGQGSRVVTVRPDATGLEFTTPSGPTHLFGEFTYSTALTPPPPIGDFIFNRSNPQAASKLYISDLTASGSDVRGSLLSMRVGSNFIFEDVATPTNSMNFHVTAIIEHTGYVEYSVDHVHTTGAISAGHTFNLENVPAAPSSDDVPLISAEDTLAGRMELASVPTLPASPDADTLYFVGSGGTSYEPDLGNPSADGQILSSTTAGTRSWINPTTARGDVTGPATAVNNRLATFSGTSGKVIQDGGTIISIVATMPGTPDANTIYFITT